MKIVITKVSMDEHLVEVFRQDGSSDCRTLNSKSFLRHDFAHFAVEAELPIQLGYWGSVAAGLSISGEGISGKDIVLAEKLAGPVQTLIRKEASPDEYLKLLERVQPSLASLDLATRIHNRARGLIGHWKATPYGSTMTIEWKATA